MRSDIIKGMIFVVYFLVQKLKSFRNQFLFNYLKVPVHTFRILILIIIYILINNQNKNEL